MSHFGTALAEYLAGPPRTSQTEFAKRCGLAKSKISRLTTGSIALDRDTLDIILDHIAIGKVRTKLVAAHLRDMASPGALLHLKSRDDEDPFKELWEYVDFGRLAPEGIRAFKLLSLSKHVGNFQNIMLELVRAFELSGDLQPPPKPPSITLG